MTGGAPLLPLPSTLRLFHTTTLHSGVRLLAVVVVLLLVQCPRICVASFPSVSPELI